VGIVDDSIPEDLHHYPCFGPTAQLGKILEDVRADRVVTALAERRGRLPVRALLEQQMRGVLVEDGLETYAYLTGKLALESVTPSSLLFSREFHRSRVSATLARGLSLVVALVGLIVTLPLMCLIGLAIKADSRGSVLFVQERMGLRGRRFRLLKFRTMLSDGGVSSEWARDNEARITRVGRWLRTFRFDELPQFVNIVRGHMNLVGPRPHPASNADLFADQIPYYALRTSVRPGVTGWAQVRYGYANDLGEEIEKMRYDLYYIKHFSVWFDLRILADTVKIVLFGRGSTTTDAYRIEPDAGQGLVAPFANPAGSPANSARESREATFQRKV
jgi:lipopolysaccharide/colanic/teichoic acid biosynthesis glycosyltransferase